MTTITGAAAKTGRGARATCAAISSPRWRVVPEKAWSPPSPVIATVSSPEIAAATASLAKEASLKKGWSNIHGIRAPTATGSIVSSGIS